MALWSVEMSESLGFKNSHILARSETLVITRSRMFSPLVGVVFSCSKKKLFINLINELSLTSIAFSREFQLARGKLKSPAITIFE
jgi:hypothetical protein